MIRQAQVFGLRSSGTNYLESLARQNFASVEVIRTDVNAEGVNLGWKHGDIGSMLPETRDGQRFNPRPFPPEVAEETLLMVCYRGPFDWLRSLHNLPHHAPEFFDINFDTFLTKPWRAYLTDEAEAIDHDPDRLRWVRPEGLIEEFDSVLHKRSQRIRMWEGFKERFPHVAYLNYESLHDQPRACLGELATAYGAALQPEFRPVVTYKGQGKEKFGGSRYAPLARGTFKQLLDTVDWEVEKAIGYDVARDAPMPDTDPIEPNQLMQFTPTHRYYANGIPVAL